MDGTASSASRGEEPSAGLPAWRAALSDRAFLVELGITLFAGVLVLAVAMRFLAWVETRPGTVLRDPVLSRIGPVDVTWITFVLIYGSLVWGLVVFLRRPRLLVFGGQAYLLLTLARVLCMWLTPLAPPEGIIPMTDPFVQGMVGKDEVMLRDLFFSGHASLPFLIFLLAPSRGMRRAFLGLTIAIGALVVLQHVHYAIDVLAAPAAAYVCFRLARRLRPE